MADKPRLRLLLEYVGSDLGRAYRPDAALAIKGLLRAHNWRCVELAPVTQGGEAPRHDGAGGVEK